jgi:phosphoglycolate phosphatase
MPFRAVVFDLDGTLLDTLTDLGESSNAALAQLGFPTHPLESYRTFVGDGVNVLIQRILPASHRDAATVARGVEAFRDVYGEKWNNRTRPYDGIVEMLDDLTARKIPMAVLSNKPHDFTVQCVQEFLPNHHFTVVMGHKQGKPTKPNPEGALEVARQLKLQSAEIAYLGDTSVDMQTACNAGMYPIGAAWGFRSVEELKAHGAKKIISRPEELLASFAEMSR